MAATVSIIERNGLFPGKTTENISGINWKAIDDVTTPYTNHQSMIGLGTNSYCKYHYIRFAGQFTSLGNVKVTHISGVLPSGIKLVSSASITQDSQKLVYSTPAKLSDTNVTPTDLSAVNSSINLLIGPANTSDPASSTNKVLIADNVGQALYTNYFVTQLQVSKTATTGQLGPVLIQISYDEV